MFDGGTQRMRKLSDAVRDLNETINKGIGIYKSSKKISIDGQSLSALYNLTVAVDNFTRQLQETNMHLSALSQRPIIGVLGGGAEAELQRLVQQLDAITKIVAEAISLARH